MGYSTEGSGFMGNDAISVVGTLKIDAESTFEISVTIYRSTWCHIPGTCIFTSTAMNTSNLGLSHD
jgi:hypothetical protein